MEEITQDDVMATYKVLEFIRDDSWLATDHESDVANEAHCAVQNIESHNALVGMGGGDN